MTAPIRIFLNGCNGRMGKVIVEMASADEDVTIVAGADPNQTSVGFPVYACAPECREDFDVIIDFSHISALPDVLRLSSDRQKPLVLCTTGLSEENKKSLFALSEIVPVFYSGNMSLGINVLMRLVKQAASILYPDFDIEIVEAHHNQKLDAPSGTALMIADAVNETLDHKLEYVYDRHDKLQKRDKKEISLHAIRGGSIIGEHQVIFAGSEEILTVSHSAINRNVFARGAIAAAKFMPGKKAGMYSMTDLVEQY